MLHDLELSIASIGGIVISSASFAARLRAWWRRFRRALGRNLERKSIAACLNAETRTQAAYSATLRLPLSPAARNGIKQQSEEISANRAYLKSLL